MSASEGPSARLSGRQAVLWGLAFAVILALVTSYLLFGRQLLPLLG